MADILLTVGFDLTGATSQKLQAEAKKAFAGKPITVPVEVGGAKAKEQFAEWEEKTKGLYGRVIRQQATSLKEQERNQTATLNRIAKSEEMGVRRKAQWIAQQDRMQQERITTSSRLDAERLSQRQRMEVATARRIESGEREGIQRKAQWIAQQDRMEQERITTSSRLDAERQAGLRTSQKQARQGLIQSLRGQEQEAKRMESSITQWRKASMVSRRAIQIQEDKARQSGFGKMKAALAEQDRVMQQGQRGLTIGLLRWAVGWTLMYGALRLVQNAFAAIIRTSLEAERAGARIAAISGATGAGIAPAGKGFAELIKATAIAVPSVNFEQAALAIREMAAAGLSYSEIQKRIIPTLQISVIQGENLTGVTRDLTGAYNTLSPAVGTYDNMLNLMAATSNRTMTTMGELASAISMMGGLMKQTTDSSADWMAMLGVLAQNNIRATRAGTMLRNTLASIVQVLPELREKFGVEIDLDKPLNLVDIIGQLNKKLGGSQNAVRVLTDLFDALEIRAGEGTLVIAGNFDQVLEMSEALSKQIPTIKEQAKALETTADKWEHLKDETIAWGSSLIDTLIKAIVLANELSKKLAVPTQPGVPGPAAISGQFGGGTTGGAFPSPLKLATDRASLILNAQISGELHDQFIQESRLLETKKKVAKVSAEEVKFSKYISGRRDVEREITEHKRMQAMQIERAQAYGVNELQLLIVEAQLLGEELYYLEEAEKKQKEIVSNLENIKEKYGESAEIAESIKDEARKGLAIQERIVAINDQLYEMDTKRLGLTRQLREEYEQIQQAATQSLMGADKFTGIMDLLTGGATNTAILQMGQFLYQTLSTSIRNAFMEQLVAERISPLIVQAAEAGRLVPTEKGGVQMADPEGFRNAIGAIKDEIKNMKPIIEEADKIIADMGKDLQKTFSVSGKGLREELKEGKVTLEDIGKAQDQIFKKKVKPVIDVQDEASGILDDIIDRISYIKNNERLNVNVTATSAGSIPGAQAGYRATRNQIIQVHRGEEVIPQGFTRRPTESGGGGGTQINVNIPNIPIGTSREEMKEFVRDYLGPTIDDRTRRALAPRRATYVRRRGVA